MKFNSNERQDLFNDQVLLCKNKALEGIFYILNYRTKKYIQKSVE
jgi:hypothetical protein